MPRRKSRSTRHTSLSLESLEARALLTAAPSPYPIATVDSATGPTLGESRGADDGLEFNSLWAGQLDAQVTVNVANTSGTAQLDAWIDFDGDGSFSDGLEQVFDSVTLSAGDNALTFDLPSWTADGPAWARFRLNSGTTGGLRQDGGQANGEIEDVMVSIAPPFDPASDTRFDSPITIASGASDPHNFVDVLTVDLDEDGHMDVVAASYDTGDIRLFSAPSGDPYASEWDTVRLSGVAGSSDQSAIDLAVADLDGDGDLDLASASEADDTIAWYENAGNGLTFTKHVINTSALEARSITPADLDRDGRIDLVSVSLADDTVRVHRNTGAGGSSQFTSLAAVTFNTGEFPADVDTIDVNRDGLQDLVVVTAETNTLSWYENDGTPFSGEQWQQRQERDEDDATDFRQGSGVTAALLDSDDEADVLVSRFDDGRLDLYRDGSGGFGAPRSIGNIDSLEGAFPAALGDIDADGDLDALAAGLDEDLATYYRSSNGTGFTATESFVLDEPTNVAIADIDRDGTLDLVVASLGSDGLLWIPNPADAGEISVRGGGSTISSGDTSPSTSNGTDFGTTELGGAGETSTFTIRNTSSNILLVSSVEIPVGYTLVTAPAQRIDGNSETDFEVRLDADALGVRTDDVIIRHNDDDGNENPYVFTITGEVVEGTGGGQPDIALEFGGTPIPLNDSSPSVGEGTDFGTAAVGAPPTQRQFTIRNTGDSALLITDLQIPAPFVGSVAFTSVPAMGSQTFTVSLPTSATGTFARTISVSSNDPDESPYTFAITGTVDAAPRPEVSVLVQGGNALLDGVSTVALPPVTVGGPTSSVTIVVRNDGDATLTLGQPTVDTSAFSVGSMGSLSLAPGNETTFRVTLETDNAGAPLGRVSFGTNDDGENPFDFFVSGTVAAPPAPDIAVFFGDEVFGVPLANGASPPSDFNGTDFGAVMQGAAPVTRTFTVLNAGNDALRRDASTQRPEGFSIANGLVSPLGPGLSDAFIVRLDTSGVGLKRGFVEIFTNDPDEDPFRFEIMGEVIAAPFVPGDFNADGRVDNGDLSLLLGSWGDATVSASWTNGFVSPVDNGELSALLGDWGFGVGTSLATPSATELALATFSSESEDDAEEEERRSRRPVKRLQTAVARRVRLLR